MESRLNFKLNLQLSSPRSLIPSGDIFYGWNKKQQTWAQFSCFLTQKKNDSLKSVSKITWHSCQLSYAKFSLDQYLKCFKIQNVRKCSNCHNIFWHCTCIQKNMKKICSAGSFFTSNFSNSSGTYLDPITSSAAVKLTFFFHNSHFPKNYFLKLSCCC